MFKFAHPEILYALFSVPVFALFFVLATNRRKKALKKFGDMEIISQLMPDVSKSKPIWKFSMTMLALTALIFVIAGPQFGSKLQEVKRKGVEIMIALDVSNSMLAEDIQPNRLERAKRAISKLVDKLSNDKIGLIVFAGDAYTQVPITTDYVSAKMFLSSISPDIVPVQGTSIGKAIGLASKSFGPESDKSRVIIVITDGENHEDNATGEASQAAKKGIVVHTIGMGLPKGAPIPIRPGANAFIKDNKGQTVISKLNERMLQEISSTGNGLYVRANNSQTGLNKLYKEINKMDKEEIESKIYTEFEDRFQYIALLALLFLVFDVFILERKNRYLRSFNLFNTEDKKVKEQ